MWWMNTTHHTNNDLQDGYQSDDHYRNYHGFGAIDHWRDL